MPFEPVYTVTEYYDGPRIGIADFAGHPHFYEAEWSDAQSNYADTFLLTPVDGETLALALEDSEIGKRWETAFHRGLADLASCPALPEDRSRHLELEKALSLRLVTDHDRALRKLGEFRPRSNESRSTPGLRPLEVRWHDPA